MPLRGMKNSLLIWREKKEKGTISLVEPTDSDQRTERVCNVFLLCPVEGPAALPSIVS